MTKPIMTTAIEDTATPITQRDPNWQFVGPTPQKADRVAEDVAHNSGPRIRVSGSGSADGYQPRETAKRVVRPRTNSSVQLVAKLSRIKDDLGNGIIANNAAVLVVRAHVGYPYSSTATTSFALFMLLLNGSGVGPDYSDEMMAVDWARDMPLIVPVVDEAHPDFKRGVHISKRDAQHLYQNSKGVSWFTVPDSREGWGRAVERVEIATYLNGCDGDQGRVNTIVLDFSDVRAEGEPIMGMQGRPSSGPAPLMDAFAKISRVKGSGMTPWRATIYIDHYLAEPVLVGGARRAARMSTKWWQDRDIFEFIGVKRPIEFDGLSRVQVAEYLASDKARPMSFLWSSNNSVTVDHDFWGRINGPITSDVLTMKAKLVYEAVMAYAYTDGTGEPGFINVDRLTADDTGLDAEAYVSGRYVGSSKFQPLPETTELLRALFGAFTKMPYHYITNPCGGRHVD